FPFPVGMTEARSVSLAQKEKDGWVEPAGVSYDLGAIRWSAWVEPGEAVTLRVAYESEGRDSFIYDVAGSGRTGSIFAEMTLSGVERPILSASSLPPTAAAEGRLTWAFDRLLTNERIRLELPPGPSPLGRLILLCQLAALAVLLFGAGFWYLSELDRPGRLDTFRWGQFLLLAGNHSLFFAVFAPLHEQTDEVLAQLGGSPRLDAAREKLKALRGQEVRNLVRYKAQIEEAQKEALALLRVAALPGATHCLACGQPGDPRQRH